MTATYLCVRRRGPLQPRVVDLLPGGEPVPTALGGAVRPALRRAGAALPVLRLAGALGTARAYDVSLINLA